MLFQSDIQGSVNGPSGLTQAADTVIVGLIPPWGGPPGSGNMLQKVNRPNKEFGRCVTRITTVTYTNGSTAHTVQIARPFNYTYVTTVAAKNTATIVLYDDPGLYAANYKYALANGAPGIPSGVADNAIAANDYVAIQLVDGSWFFSKITSVSTLTLTLTTSLPNPTGAGGVAVGAPVYFYGQITTDKNPADGVINPGSRFVSATRGLWQDLTSGIVTSYNHGDPLLIYSGNATAQGYIDNVSGFYAIA